MSELFQIYPTSVVSCVAREEILELTRNLSSDNSNNLSIVGPRGCGKTTMIKEVVKRINSNNSNNKIIVEWDLAEDTPIQNDQFQKQLCENVIKTLYENRNLYMPYQMCWNSRMTILTNLI